MERKNISLFEIFGPSMIGPSSSHTAGIVRITYLAKKILGEKIEKAKIYFYGSLAYTYKGHGSDKAAIAGLLGLMPDDEKVSKSFVLAKKEKLKYEIIPVYEFPEGFHNNTVIIELSGKKRTLRLQSASIGGGSIRIEKIDDFSVELNGEFEALLVLHHDEVGVIAIVSHILAANRINIASAVSHREEKGSRALLVLEVDSPINKKIIEQIEDLPPIYRVVYVPKIC